MKKAAKNVATAITDMIQVAWTFVFGAIIGGVFAVVGSGVVNDVFPHAFAGCNGLGCLHPVYTIIMPIGAFAGGVIAVVILSKTSPRR